MSQVVLSAEAISLDNTDQNRDQYEQQTSQVALVFGSQSESCEPMVYHQLVQYESKQDKLRNHLKRLYQSHNLQRDV